MTEPRPVLGAEEHRALAKRLHGEVWELLGRAGRTPAECERMTYAAYASCYHWLEAGTAAHHARGEWLIARVHTVLGERDAAVAHASRCLALVEGHPEAMEDFDLPFGHEALARAYALSGDRPAALRHLALARESGGRIAEEDDREVFFEELDGGEWHGLA